MNTPFKEAVHHFDKAWTEGTMPHAWLFLGPKGIGKKDLCVHLASIVFGKEKLGYIVAGTYPDFLHFSSASVADIHAFKQRVLQTTITGGWRVICLTDVDTLNVFVLNALLKIVEEPPPRSIFLLTAEKPIMATIASRCVTQRLMPLSKSLFFQQVSPSEELYALSGGYSTLAHKLVQEGIFDVAKNYWTFLDQASLGPIVLPGSFVNAMVAHALQWTEWTQVWFQKKFQEQWAVTQMQHVLERIKARLQEAITFHLDMRFVLQEVFAILSVEFPRE